jgi:hypothetical protein
VFSGDTIISQVVDLIQPQQFRWCVARYRGNYKVKAYKAQIFASTDDKVGAGLMKCVKAGEV